MQILSQQDPSWKNVKIGTSPYTLGMKGCNITSITNIYNYLFKENKTPSWMCAKLEYTKDGLVIWSSLKNVGMKLYASAVDTDPTALINRYWPNPNTCTILEINHCSHFVWQLGKNWPYLGYRIGDPWNGKTTYTGTMRYKVTGCRVIGRA